MSKNRYYDPFEFINMGKSPKKLDVEKKNIYEPAPTELINNKKTKRAYLYRMDNNEKIIINKTVYVIGKNDACNYVITGNNAISRQHAEIQLKNNGVYIVDKKSTNKTFVNGNAIQPEHPTKIVNGDEIKLANIEFKLSIE